ncbi:MAG: DMT family transporter [Phycisphaerales bacterium]|nr:MAG: DMT family transporter [Phycisphaerales bacterium]
MSTQEPRHRIAYLYALAAVAFWSTSATAFKLSLRHVDTLGLLFFASLTSTVALLVYLILTRKLAILRTFTRRDYLFSAAMGFLNPFLYYVILFKAYSLLLAQEAQPINFVWPLTLVLLSIPLLGQRIKLGSIVAICISFSGVVVIGTRGDVLGFRFSNPTGVLLALSTTIVWSLFWIFNTKDKQEETVRLLLNFAFATLLILIALLGWGQATLPPIQGLVGGIYVGLFEMGITFLLWLKALKGAPTTAHVVNLIYLVPFLSLFWIAAVLKERIFPSTLIGLVLIVTGIVLQKRWGSATDT